jgi:hypothetical protein
VETAGMIYSYITLSFEGEPSQFEKKVIRIFK